MGACAAALWCGAAASIALALRFGKATERLLLPVLSSSRRAADLRDADNQPERLGADEIEHWEEEWRSTGERTALGACRHSFCLVPAVLRLWLFCRA